MLEAKTDKKRLFEIMQAALTRVLNEGAPVEQVVQEALISGTNRSPQERGITARVIRTVLRTRGL